MKIDTWIPAAKAVGTIVMGVCLSYSTPAAADQPAPNRATSRFETDFLRRMIDHHGMAVEMASMCLSKEVRPALRSTCSEIAMSQQAEIATMQSWLTQWYGVKQEAPRMKGDEHRQMQELQSLQGAAFERSFLEMMTPHHATAISRSVECLVLGYHPALLDTCKTIAVKQAEESRTFRAWLCEGFSQCVPSERMRRMWREQQPH